MLRYWPTWNLHALLIIGREAERPKQQHIKPYNQSIPSKIIIPVFTLFDKDQDWFAKHGKQGKLNDSSRYIDKNYFECKKRVNCLKTFFLFTRLFSSYKFQKEWVSL